MIVTTDCPMTIDSILKKYDPDIAAIAASLREFLIQELEGITETPDHAASLIGYGYGTGYTGMICVIMLSKKEVKLGFYQGSSLPDPQKLLTGKGKVHRYLPINSPRDIHGPAVKKFIRHALAAYKKRKQ